MSEKQDKRENNRVLLIILVLFLCAILIITIVLFALLLAPKKISGIPEFEIEDNHGVWEEQGTVAVFDNKIKPGDSGEYQFIISNVTDVKLRYAFVLEEHYSSNDIEWTPFLKYRIRMNGKLVETDAWLSADELSFDDLVILANTKHLMTLEWRWAWDDDNANDTKIGNRGGEFSIRMQLKAEVAN